MPRSGSGRLTLVGAPALVRSLVVLLTEVPVLHVHQGQGAGLYDDECAALRLATSPNRYGPSPRPLVGIRGLSPAGAFSRWFSWRFGCSVSAWRAAKARGDRRVGEFQSGANKLGSRGKRWAPPQRRL